MNTATFTPGTAPMAEFTSCITFNSPPTEEVLRLDKEGFHYRGQFIADAGEAHRLMVEFLKQNTRREPQGATDEAWQWYSYCPEDGIELHLNKELAQNAAQEIMGSYAKAAHSDGWHEDMESVSWGMLLPVEQAQVTERTEAELGSDFDEWIRYELVPSRYARPAIEPQGPTDGDLIELFNENDWNYISPETFLDIARCVLELQ